MLRLIPLSCFLRRSLITLIYLFNELSCIWYDVLLVENLFCLGNIVETPFT